jgi:hypothetical protein
MNLFLPTKPLSRAKAQAAKEISLAPWRFGVRHSTSDVRKLTSAAAGP